MAAFRIREFISSRPESMLDDPDRSVVAACHLTAPRGTVMRYSKVMPPDTHVVSVHLQSSSHHRFGISESVLHDGPAHQPKAEHRPCSRTIRHAGAYSA